MWGAKFEFCSAQEYQLYKHHHSRYHGAIVQLMASYRRHGIFRR